MRRGSRCGDAGRGEGSVSARRRGPGGCPQRGGEGARERVWTTNRRPQRRGRRRRASSRGTGAEPAEKTPQDGQAWGCRAQEFGNGEPREALSVFVLCKEGRGGPESVPSCRSQWSVFRCQALASRLPRLPSSSLQLGPWVPLPPFRGRGKGAQGSKGIVPPGTERNGIGSRS